MPSPSSFWKEFIEGADKKSNKTPVLLSLLKQLKPISLTDTSIVLGCPNQGMKFFLERKAEEVGGLLFEHLNKYLQVEFTLVEDKKRQEKDAPLLSFQPSLADLFTKAGLHAKYRFENFAVSSSNQVAFAATQAIADNPGSSYNPLFLHGGVGVGKTHLAQSVARKLLERDVQKRVFFCSGEHFMNELIESIREKSTPRFRKKYRSLDLIIIDDIQFIAGKQTVQEEFFHTFNSVVSAGGQIILTSDRPPEEIKNLEDRLRSRFSGGLIVDIQNPDFELRTAILLIKAREKNIEIDIEAAKIIAERITDTRALEGALLSLYAKILGIKEQIDLGVVDTYFSKQQEVRAMRTSPGDIIKAVCMMYNVKQSQLKAATRSENIALPRQIAMYILRNDLKLRLEEVADILHRKDHTTVMHAVDKIGRLLLKDPSLKREIDEMRSSLHL